MGRFVKWVRPPAQFKYGLIAALQIMLLKIRIENFSFHFIWRKASQSWSSI